MPRLRRLLWIDCSGGLAVGVLVLSLSGWLAALYDVPRALVAFMGAANLAYGAFSLSLARRARPPRSLVVLLAAANMTWAVLCVLAALRLAGTASAFGLAHFVLEGLWVGALGWMEWAQRDGVIVAT